MYYDLEKGGVLKVGDRFKTNESGDIIVTRYLSHRKVFVKFVDDHVAEVSAESGNIRKGMVSNPYRKTILGVGFIGEGRFRSSKSGEMYKIYQTWVDVLKRSYCPKFKEKYPTYADVTVCDEWLNYQVFAEWFVGQENYLSKGYDLDKDILIKNNKIYSPETTRVVPHDVNVLFTDAAGKRGDYCIGVSERDGYYIANIRVKGSLVQLGKYLTEEQAYSTYKAAKEQLVKDTANEYIENIPEEIYNAMMNWTLDYKYYKDE